MPAPVASARAVPRTPTRPGKGPATGSFSKLGKPVEEPSMQTPSKAPAVQPPKSISTPKRKGPIEQAKQATPKPKATPKLPPRPPPQSTQKPAVSVRKGDESAKKMATKAAPKAPGRIVMKDNESEEVEVPGKISQPGNETGGEESSATGEELGRAPAGLEGDEGEGVYEGGPVRAPSGVMEQEESPEISEGEDIGEQDIGAKAVQYEEEGFEPEEFEEPEQGQETPKAKAPVSRMSRGVKDTAGGLLDGAKVAGKATRVGRTGGRGIIDGGVTGVADDAVRATKGAAKKAPSQEGRGLINGAQGMFDKAVGKVGETFPVDLSILKGLRVGEGGEVMGANGEQVGELVEGDSADVVGLPIGDDGVILDEEGDVVGRTTVLAEQAQKLAKQIPGQLPLDLSILKGLEIGEDGKIFGVDGEQVGQLEEGDPEDLAGYTIGDNGEILDEDNDVIGRATILPLKAQQLAKQVEAQIPVDLSVLKGLQVSEGGEVLGPDGTPYGKLVEGDPEDLAGQVIDGNGEILDEEGDPIGRCIVLPEKAKELAEKAQRMATMAGLKVGDQGDILDDEGNPIGKLVEGKVSDLVGQTLDAQGNIHDKEGNIIGRAELLPAEAGELIEPDLSILLDKKVNKKGNVLNDEGNIIGQLIEDSDLKACVGRTPNEVGEIVDDEGKIVGYVEIVPGQAANETMKALHPEGVPSAEAKGLGLEMLEGMKPNLEGVVLNANGEPIAKLIDGDVAAAAGNTINENGEVIDKNGNVVGKVELIPEMGGVQLPSRPLDLSFLQGYRVNKKGEVFNEDGEQIAKLVEGNLADVAGEQLNENGEILDEDGNILGRVELVGKAAEEAQAAAAGLGQPEAISLSMLEGLKVNKKGKVLNEDGDVIAELCQGEVSACKGKKINSKGLILDEDGNILGKVELLQEEEAAQVSPLADYAGYKLSKKGQVLNEDGEPIAQLAEGELGELAGKRINEKGEILGSDGMIIGRVELILPEESVSGLALLEGKSVNKKGLILDADGEPIGKLVDGNLDLVSGKIVNAQGEILDDDGEIIGRVEAYAPEEVPSALALLEGSKVNKKGEVVNEDGEPVAWLVEGELEDVVGKKLNSKGEIVNDDGEVIGRCELILPEELPPLSILSGLRCNKAGMVVDDDGTPIGELVEGDPKKLARLGVECDDKGQFWDSKGNVLGRAKTIRPVTKEEEPLFAGLEGLIIVQDGWVEDENENIVGQLVEGDAKKLVGRAVDEDGDVIDKRGNVVGRAERYEIEEPEPEIPDLSFLAGLTINKQGNVIGPQGIPVARLVEGNPKELAGKKVDGEGQIWNDAGKVIGRVEAIPESEREEKIEGPFAGLEGVHVVKGGMVEDEEGNSVGVVVEGDPKKLVGRIVDEDGDIVDKYGNVKGHAEPYEEPEEEPVDMSILEGKIVNKAGNVVDERGTVYGRVIDGDVRALIGHKVDGNGRIWSDNGQVIGQAELIPGDFDVRPEGPFSGFEDLRVAKEGIIQTLDGQIVGRLIDGDPMKLLGRAVDEDGDIVDKNGNTIGRAERWEPEAKKREINPMSGHKVNKDGEIRDEDGNVLGKVTAGNLLVLIGKEVDDNGYIVDSDGNRIGDATLLQNIPEPTNAMAGHRVNKDGEVRDDNGDLIGKVTAGNIGALVGKLIDDNGYVVDNQGNKIGECTLIENLEEGPTEDAEIADKMSHILQQTIDQMNPVLEQITTLIEKADRTPKDELDEEELVSNVRPLIEEGSRILQECNGALRGLDPDGRIAAQAKARAGTKEATPEEHRLAELLKELTQNVVKTIDNARRRISDMPHAKKELNPLWALLTEPLFQIIAAVGLLLSGVLGLVGRLLNGLGLGGLVNGLLGGLGIDKLLGGLGLGSVVESLGLGGKKKK